MLTQPLPPQERYSRLSSMLRERLKTAEDGDVAAVREAAQKDADRLSQLPFGAPMLHLIGCAMELSPGCLRARARVRARVASRVAGWWSAVLALQTCGHAVGASLSDCALSRRLHHLCRQ